MLVIVVIANLCIDESPRFLICNQQTDEAEKVLQKIGRLNGELRRDEACDPENKTIKLIDEDIIQEINKTAKTGSSILDLFKNGPEMIQVTIICMFSRLIVGTVYWILVLNAAALPFNLHTNNFINSLCGIPGYILANYMVKSPKFGRKLTAAILCCESGIFVLLSGMFNELGYCSLNSEDRFSNVYVVLGFVCSLLGRATISGCLGTWYLYIAELFPTSVRGNALGLCASMEAIAGVLTPVLLNLSVYYSWFPSVVVGLIAVFGGFIVCFLPETLEKPMLMNMDQAKRRYSTDPESFRRPRLYSARPSVVSDIGEFMPETFAKRVQLVKTVSCNEHSEDSGIDNH